MRKRAILAASGADSLNSVPMLRSTARFIAGHLLPRVPYPVLTGPLKGCRFVLGSLAGEGGGASVYFNAVEPEQTRALMDLLGPGQVFYDIGANVGYYTLLASRLVGETGSVIALEPAERNLAYLRRHLAINDVGNARVIPEAVADHVGEARFDAGANPAEGHLAGIRDGDGSRTGPMVPVTTLDALVERTALAPNVVKMDIEGAELLALQGAARTLATAKPALLLSVHSETLRDQCGALLQAHGYQLMPLTPMEFVAKAD